MVSPLLWSKVARGLSAGRVQSVAVRLIVEREREIRAFVPEEYWKVTGIFTTDLLQAPALSDEWLRWLSEAGEKKNGKRNNGRTVMEKNEWLSAHSGFSAELVEVDGAKIESRRFEKVLAAAKRAGFHPDDQRITENPNAKAPANRLVQLLGHLEPGPRWQVKSIQTKRTKSRPFAPFITSTLQQAAANQLDFSAQFTMGVAQNL